MRLESVEKGILPAFWMVQLLLNKKTNQYHSIILSFEKTIYKKKGKMYCEHNPLEENVFPWK